jgi:hypothetical protein
MFMLILFALSLPQIRMDHDEAPILRPHGTLVKVQEFAASGASAEK